METVYMSMKFSDYPDSVFPVVLMSIGLISEDGTKSFYAEISRRLVEVDVSPFFMDNVFPLFDAEGLSHPIDYHEVHAKMTRDECRTHLTEWLRPFGNPVQIVSNTTDEEYDFAFDLFCGNIRQNKLLTHFDKLIFTEEERLTYIRIFHSSYKEGYRRHHALDDAKVMRLAIRGE
jgi:hypothetical protein